MRRFFLKELSIKKDIRKLLRSKTLALHRQAEAAFETAGPIESPEGLSHFLNCMLVAHSRYRPECDQAAELAGLEARSDSLIAALKTDLNLHSCPQPVLVPQNHYYCLGVGYVFEGSAMGANVLINRLIKSRNPKPTYLSIVAIAARSRWPQYLKLLDSCQKQNCVVLGAVDAFKFIINRAESRL